MNKKDKVKMPSYSKWIITLSIVLSVLGLPLIYSASSGDIKNVYGQLLGMVIGVGIIIAMQFIKSEDLYKLIVIVGGSFFVIACIIKEPLSNLYDSWRPNILQVGQVSIRMDLILVLVFFFILAGMSKKIEDESKFIIFSWVTAIVFAWIVHYWLCYNSVCVILLAAFMSTFCLTRKKIQHIIVAVVLLLSNIVVIWATIDIYNSNNIDELYYRIRQIVYWLVPEENPYPLIVRAQDIASESGLFGKGFMNGIYKYESFSAKADDIFVTVNEEFGWIGASILLLIILLLISMIIRAAVMLYKKGNKFGVSIAVSVAVHIFLNTFLNVTTVFGLLPSIAGIIPFISYGRNMLIFTFFEIACVLAIVRDTNSVKKLK